MLPEERMLIGLLLRAVARCEAQEKVATCIVMGHPPW